jgi:superfamily II DNA/RNA helicase
MIPPGGQRLLFSATLDKGIDELVERYLTDPVDARHRRRRPRA